MKHSKITIALLVLTLALTSCGRDNDTKIKPSPADSGEAFVVPEGPTLHEVSYENAPIYFYLFTHTEDPFNHELSEDKYWRGGEILEAFAKAHPEIPVTWTIEFQGSDAQTVAERNQDTGVVDYLLELNESELVEFGYHGHHDPTYQNRPQNDLGANPTWEEAYDAIHEWITCEKDLLYGGCINKDGGGLQAVMDTFGQVEIVTGIGITDGVLIERSAGASAIKEELPDRWLGFGFPNHGAVLKDRNYTQALTDFLGLFTPTGDTSSGTLWMDNSIRSNDDATLENAKSIGLENGLKEVKLSLENADRSSPLVLHASYISKYVYTKTGTSPTIWGYSHPESPELPDEWLLSTKEIDQNYKNVSTTLNYLGDTFIPENEGSGFVTSDGVMELFTSDDFWAVDEEELYQLSLWLLNHWEGAPPNFAYDGEDFYSLTDAFYLLARGLQEEFPEDGIVSHYWGPWSIGESDGAATMEMEALRDWIADFGDTQIPESITIGKETWNPAQVLYALAMLYASEHDNAALESLFVDESTVTPESYGYLETLGCTGCLDTSWSLKPARFQD